MELINRRTVLRATVLLVLLAILGCSSPTPEEQIQASIAEAQKAAESGDVRTLQKLISPVYSDDEGRDKAAIDSRILYYLTRNRSIYLFVRVRSIRVVERGRAEVALLVAAAGSPIRGPRALAEIDADLVRMDLEVRAAPGSAWKITSASWRRAGPRDFF